MGIYNLKNTPICNYKTKTWLALPQIVASFLMHFTILTKKNCPLLKNVSNAMCNRWKRCRVGLKDDPQHINGIFMVKCVKSWPNPASITEGRSRRAWVIEQKTQLMSSYSFGSVNLVDLMWLYVKDKVKIDWWMPFIMPITHITCLHCSHSK